MLTGKSQDLHQKVAAELLAVFPSWLFSTEPVTIRSDGSPSGLRIGAHDTADHLVDLLQRCLKGESEALDEARALAEAHRSERNTNSNAAAWDLLYRILEKQSADLALDFIRVVKAKDFQSLPLVDAVVDRFPIAPDSPLRSAHILACRHLMASTVAELDAIHRILPHAEFVRIIGKPYSTNRLALIELSRRGYIRDDTIIDSDPSDHEFGSYGQMHRRVTREAVDQYLAQYPDSRTPLVVIDDGGALIDAVGQKVLDGTIRCPVVAIEQTTHGYYALNRKFLDARGIEGFAIVRAFQSQAKISYEAPLIAQSVLKETWTWLTTLRGRADLDIKLPDDPVFGIIGLGVVGSMVARELAEAGHVVAVYDKSRQKIGIVGSSSLPNIEMAWSLQDLCKYANVIIGASGGTSIGEDATSALRNGTVLVSASSGDREFRGMRRDWEIDLLPMTSGAVSPYEFAHGLLVARDKESDRRVYIVNRGYPVNFDGSPDPIPPSDIQLTRALMVGAVIQAAGPVGFEEGSLVGKSGHFEVNETIDRFLIERFRSRG